MAENANSDGGMSGAGRGGYGSDNGSRGGGWGGGGGKSSGGYTGGFGLGDGDSYGGSPGDGGIGDGIGADRGGWGSGLQHSGTFGPGYGITDAAAPSIGLNATIGAPTNETTKPASLTSTEAALAKIATTLGIGALGLGPVGLIGNRLIGGLIDSAARPSYSLGANYGLVGDGTVATGTGTGTANAGANIGDYRGGGAGGSGAGRTNTGQTGGSMTAAPSDIGSLFDLFFAGRMGGQGEGSFKPPAYAQDPTGLYGRAGESMRRYENNFNDTYGLMRNQVMQFNNPGFMASQRASRMADVQQQSDRGFQTAMRDRMRMGLNPNSGAMDAMQNQRAMQTALGKVQAAASSDNELRGMYTQGLSGLGAMNEGYGKMGLGLAGIGNDANRNFNSFNMAGAELGFKANGGALDWSRLAMDKYRADKGLESDKYRTDASNDVNWGALAAGSLLSNDRVTDGIVDWILG